MVRRLLAIGPLFLAGALALACASPTLPLPPPAIPSVASGSDADHVKLSAQCGGAEANAIIVIVNSNTSVPGDLSVTGSRADGCGAWDANVYAHAGDYLDVTQEFGTTRSSPVVVEVPTTR